ncbi:hypothetical protein [Desulforhopalus singaporensis]|uniref:Predicted glycosyl transferase n=1 Tax=Desulforhopalus singaporensis TaxID=91360 RepID=A0A1H0QVM1_9BACT|nr:hypothetical protein [Desulforhopalus singaporensis]SDP21371.1 Predicted glycosyl transferase [Desulforhopalus singaporensis]
MSNGGATRLDILIYAHDGRGLGHASRSIAIGMALRSLYPALRVLFVSGCSFSQELIGTSGLDWLKLPSYRTEVVDGKSRGIPGYSNFGDHQLGVIRSRTIAHYVEIYRPRVVLVDHTPQGKHRELVPAIEDSWRKYGPESVKWVLGVRGVVGAVRQARSALSAELFRKYYDTLLWYGDSGVLGRDHLVQLERQYGVAPVECGYVSRLAEQFPGSRGVSGTGEKYAGTVSVPWIGEKSIGFLRNLAEALKGLGTSVGVWRLFVGGLEEGRVGPQVSALFQDIENCRVEPPSARYVPALLQSKTALVYGGYNSLMDVIYAGIPFLAVLREMQDEEQRIHVGSILQAVGDRGSVLGESELSVDKIMRRLSANLQAGGAADPGIDLQGARTAAARLYRMVVVK